MVAFRFLRARRQEGFVSVIAIFSLLGIALGVATLIIVMSVMNGFRADLVNRILGFNGHLGVYGEAGMLTDFDAVAAKVRAVPGVVSATPMIEGPVMATSEHGAAGDQATREGRMIAAALGGGVRIVDWQHANSSLVSAVEIERNVMFLILTLIIVVAAFNIISGMIMMVKDKGRDIAILRTMGASRGMVLRIFMLSGASIGVVGTLAGFALGVLFTENIEPIRQFLQGVLGVNLFSAEIYFFTRIPAHLQTGDVAAVVLMALALSFLATLYPSWRAARLDPVEGLRYE